MQMEEIRINYDLDKDLEKKINEIHLMLKEIADFKKSPISSLWIPSEVLRNDLGIKSRTEYLWKAKGIIKSSKIRGKNYYKVSDLLDLLSENYNRTDELKNGKDIGE